MGYLLSRAFGSLRHPCIAMVGTRVPTAVWTEGRGEVGESTYAMQV